MTDEQLDVCQICLNLCRDVCPVSVHAWRDDLMPNHKVRAAASVLEVGSASEATLEQLDACTDCGACTTFCHFSVPVAEILGKARAVLEAAGSSPATLRPQPAAAPVLRATELQGAVILPCCKADDPALDLPRVEPPLGSSCCGAVLPAGVGTPDLHQRMARGMLAEVPDGAVVVVADAGCAAHLHASAEGRVRVVVADAVE